MSLLDALRADDEIPEVITERIKRGKERMQRESGKRNECWGFYRGEQFYWTNAKRTLVPDTQTANADGQRKPPYVNRTVRNFIVDVVAAERSAATQRVPSYQVAPSTSDQEDIYAARLGEKVSLYGYDKWGIRLVTDRVVTHAVVADEGFAWPYFDNTVGPYIADGIGEGEIKIRTFGANEVFWEPGVSFEESRWLGIEQARDIEDVMEMEGYNGGKLRSDASTSETNLDAKQDTKLVLVTDYLERPCPKYPEGRWLTMANGKMILEPRAYPCTKTEGGKEVPVDEPVLHKLSYFADPDSDRDLGLVRFLLDPQRTINGAVNRLAEWVHLALNPQMVIWNGGLAKGQRRTSEPGAVLNAYGTAGKIEWVPTPNVPPELFQQKHEALADIDRIAGRSLTDASQIESGKEAQAYEQQDTSRRYSFTANLAEFQSRLMRHCLYLVQKHYTEDRLVKIQGRSGPDLTPSFRGSDLRGQVDVRVDPDSIAPRTKEGMRQEIMNIAQMFPGYFTPEVLLSAMNGGTAEKLIETYELDVSRANTVIQQIRQDPESFLQNTATRPVFPNEDPGPKIDPATNQPIPVMGPGGPVVDPGPVDPMTGMPGEPVPRFVQETEVPEWMPRPFDGIPIQMAIFEDFMKTQDYELLPPPGKEACHLYYQALVDIKNRKAAEQAQQQTMMAEQQGMNNAANPQGPKPNPSLPALPQTT